MDASTGHDLSRWFPLSSPSDYLYFLPPRRGIDTNRKLRLISSVAGLSTPLESLYSWLHGLNLGVDNEALVSHLHNSQEQASERGIRTVSTYPMHTPALRARHLFGNEESHPQSVLRKVKASSADHYRAVPLSDGYHVLFTDPRTGQLCLGTDAPVGPLARLLRKIHFRPPAGISESPVLYAAGSDTRHGIRVVATFLLDSKRQAVVFFTVSPDLFYDVAQLEASMVDSNSWDAQARYRAIDVFSEPFRNCDTYPIEIHGQCIDLCDNLVEVVLRNDSSGLIIWAFSSDGWARTYALDNGKEKQHAYTSMQRDGSLRQMDDDDDMYMPDAASSHSYQLNLARREPETSRPYLDGAVASGLGDITPPRDSDRRPTMRFWNGRTSATRNLDVADEADGITRVDVELR